MDLNNFDFGAELSEAIDHVKVWPKDGEMTALIDGDLIPYIIGYSVDPMMWLRAQNRVADGHCYGIIDTPEFAQIQQKICMVLNDWVEQPKCDSAVIYMTDSAKNFRLNLAIQRKYKGTRKSEKPPFFYESRDFMINHLGAILSDGEEADDLLTTHLWEHQFNGLIENGIELGSATHKELARFVMVSKDKDLAISPGWHYSISERKLHWVTPLGELLPQWNGDKLKKLRGTGLKFFYSQILQGDQVDNYTGIPRMRLKDIYDLLEPCKSERELYNATLSAYRKKYGEEAYIANYRGGGKFLKPYEIMHEQGRLAHMQRFKGEIWRSDKVPVLWGSDGAIWK